MENLQKITLTNGQTHELSRNEALAYKVEDFVLNETRIAFEDGGQEFQLQNQEVLPYIAYGCTIYEDRQKRIQPIYGQTGDIQRLTQKPTREEIIRGIMSEINYIQHVLVSRYVGEEKTFLEGQLKQLQQQAKSLHVCPHCGQVMIPEDRLSAWKPGDLYTCPECGWTAQATVLEKHDHV